MTDTSLHAAYSFVTGLHACKPDRLLSISSLPLTCRPWIDFSVLMETSINLYVYFHRPAIAWATWDLIAMVDDGKHDWNPTHSVTFVWNGHEVTIASHAVITLLHFFMELVIYRVEQPTGLASVF